jgi:uncharacterized protein
MGACGETVTFAFPSYCRVDRLAEPLLHSIGPHQIRFAADRMLGRLAKMLRLLGYDTLYSPNLTTAELKEIAGSGDRVILTRGTLEKRFSGVAGAFRVNSEYAPEQLREVVKRFQLDAHAGLWTRCTLCNAVIEQVDKAAIQGMVAPKVFEIYDRFFRCSGCAHVYWCGSHVERILRNLEALLGTSDDG